MIWGVTAIKINMKLSLNIELNTPFHGLKLIVWWAFWKSNPKAFKKSPYTIPEAELNSNYCGYGCLWFVTSCQRIAVILRVFVQVHLRMYDGVVARSPDLVRHEMLMMIFYRNLSVRLFSRWWFFDEKLFTKPYKFFLLHEHNVEFFYVSCFIVAGKYKIHIFSGWIAKPTTKVTIQKQ